MELKELQADHKARAEAVATELHQVIAQQQVLAQRRQALTEEALRLNGEARMLQRMSKDGEQ
jgi:hypothetical protein